MAAPFLLLVLHSQGIADNERSSAQKNQRAQMESEYSQLMTEMKLADAAVPYLVLNLPRKQIEIRLQAVVVWNRPFKLSPKASGDLDEFIRRFQGSSDEDVRYVWEKRLFAAQGRFSDSVIAIVTKVLEVEPELLQRQMPSRFQLEWGDNLILEFQTGLDIKTKKTFKTVLNDVISEIRRPWNQIVLTADMSAEDAITLYRIAHPGMPTMIITAPQS